MDPALEALSVAVGDALHQQGLTLACAESCTGGRISEIVTATAGSSAWFDRGFVTYSNAAKQEMLGIEASLLEHCGAVSEEIVQVMAQGALAHSRAQIALAVSGIAGPGGGSSSKPVGTVCFAWCWKDKTPRSETRHFSGTRETIRHQAAMHALNGLLALLEHAKLVP